MIFNKIKFSDIIKIGIVLTMALGILLRIQFTGIDFLSSDYDWYRLHTHIGYYLFLLPSVLWSIQSKVTKFLYGYFFISCLTLILFFFQGYSLASKVFSGIIYLFWIYQSFQNEVNANKWLWISRYGLLTSLIFLILVIILPKYSMSWDSAQLAKGFLLSIFVTVILPTVLGRKFFLESNLLMVVFLFSGVLLSLVSIQVLSHYFSIISVVLSIIILFKSLGSWIDKIISSLIIIILALVVSLKANFIYQAKIAGLHFIFLGPVLEILLSQFRAFNYRKSYYANLLIFCFLIFLLGIIPENSNYLNLLISFFGISLLGHLLFSWQRKSIST